jgi:hypothetical protein
VGQGHGFECQGGVFYDAEVSAFLVAAQADEKRLLGWHADIV